MNELWCVWCRKDCKLTVHALFTSCVSILFTGPHVPSVTKLWCVLFFLPPYFSSSFTLPAALLIIHEMQSQERKKREWERARGRLKHLKKSTGRVEKMGQKEGGDALKHCCRVEVQDGLMEDRVGRKERTAEDRGLFFFSFFLLPSISFSSPYRWAELSRRSTLRIQGEGKRKWLA